MLFNPSDLLTVFDNTSKNPENPPNKTTIHEPLSGIVASYTAPENDDKFEFLIAKAVACVVGLDKLDTYDEHARGKVAVSLGSVRCVGWAESAKGIVYVIDGFYNDLWYRFLIRPTQKKESTQRYDVRFWKIANAPQSVDLKIPKEDLEKITGISLKHISDESWYAYPEIYLGGLQLLLGVETWAQLAEQHLGHRAQIQDMLECGYNATGPNTTDLALVNTLENRGASLRTAILKPLGDTVSGSNEHQLCFVTNDVGKHSLLSTQTLREMFGR